jgi:hypothetical protein
MAYLLIINLLGASRKRQPCVAAFTNGMTRAGPMSVANALGLDCKPRLDLTLS